MNKKTAWLFKLLSISIFVFFIVVPPVSAQTSLPELLSLSSSGTIADFGVEGYGGGPDGHAFAISDDGRFVAFRSSASNLGGSGRMVYLRDRQTGTTTPQATVSANGDFSLSANGQKLMLLSTATNLDPRSTDGTQRCFVRDLATDTTELVSLDGNGQVQDARFCAMSDDGTVIAFTTFAGSIFIRNLVTNVVTTPPASFAQLSLSGNGRYLSYDSGGQAVVYDVITGISTLTTVNPDGSPASGTTNNLDTISRDGRYVFIRSGADLDPIIPCTGPVCSYRRDIVKNTTELLWEGAGGWSSRDGLSFAYPSSTQNVIIIERGTTTFFAGYNRSGEVGDGSFMQAVGLNATGSLIGIVINSHNFLPTGISNESTQLYLSAPLPQLSAVETTKFWISRGLLDFGLRLDVLAEVYKDDTLVTSGQLNGVTVGSGTFANATRLTIPFDPFSPVLFPPGSQLKIKYSVRNACNGSLRNNGTARIWFNDTQANSFFNATIGESTYIFYLRDNFVLTPTVGNGPRQNIAMQVGQRCSTFKPLGTWLITP